MIYRWRGTTNGSWTTSSNWVDETGTAYSSGYPGSAGDYQDYVYFDAAPVTSLDGGNYSTGGILASVEIGSAYTGSIGSESMPLVIPAQRLIIAPAASAETIAIRGGTKSGWTDGITDVLITQGGNVMLGGTVQHLRIMRGTVTLDSGMTIGGSLVIGQISGSTDATVTIPYISSLPSTVTAYGGAVTCYSAIGTLRVLGGTWTHAHDGNSAHSADIGSLEVGAGATVYWRGGNIGTLVCRGGTVSASGGTAPRQLGSGEVYPGGVVSLDNGQDNILITGAITSYGGNVVLSSGYELAPYRHETYAGANDAGIGIQPQNLTSTASGTGIYVALQDRLDVYVYAGAITSGCTITVKLQAATTSGGTYSDIPGYSTTLTGTADSGKCKRITLWGSALSSARWVRVYASASGGSGGYIACVPVHSRH